MKDVLGVVALVLFVVAMFVFLAVQDTRCREAGGTYLWREAKCIEVKEIHP